MTEEPVSFDDQAQATPNNIINFPVNA